MLNTLCKIPHTDIVYCTYVFYNVHSDTATLILSTTLLLMDGSLLGSSFFSVEIIVTELVRGRQTVPGLRGGEQVKMCAFLPCN